jgi:hypothetical protein
VAQLRTRAGRGDTASRYWTSTDVQSAPSSSISSTMASWPTAIPGRATISQELLFSTVLPSPSKNWLMRRGGHGPLPPDATILHRAQQARRGTPCDLADPAAATSRLAIAIVSQVHTIAFWTVPAVDGLRRLGARTSRKPWPERRPDSSGRTVLVIVGTTGDDLKVKLRLGYKASSEQFGPGELLRYGVLAEECGFDSVFASDHLQPWRHDDGHAPFAMSWLAALGARTERVVMGTSVLTPTFRYHPAIVAQAFATLGCLFPGRVVLGMGTGESMNEVPLGMEWPDGKERFARFREAVRLIRQLWAEERVSFEGDFYRTDKATIYDRPDGPIPIYLAGSGPAATRYAGRQGDGYITTSGKNPDLYTGHATARRPRRRRAGRPGRRGHRHDDRGEGVLRSRLGCCHGSHPLLGRAGTDAGAKVGGRRSSRDAAAGRPAERRTDRKEVHRIH